MSGHVRGGEVLSMLHQNDRSVSPIYEVYQNHMECGKL